MQDHKSVLDDALHSLTRKIVQSVAGSVAVMAAAGGILVVPEILSEKSVTAAIAKLSEPTQQIQSVIVMAADVGQRAKSRMAVMEPAMEPARKQVVLASAEPESLMAPPPATVTAPESSPFQPEPAPRVLPEARDPRFNVFDPMPDMPRVSVDEPKPVEAARPAPSKPVEIAKPEPKKPVEEAKPEVKKPVEVAKPVATQPIEVAPQAAVVKPAEPVVVSLPMPPERPKSLAARPVETPKAVGEERAAKPAQLEVPKEVAAAAAASATIAAPVAAPQEPVQFASVDPQISASTLALISAEAFGMPVISEGPPDIAPDAKPPVAEEAIPTEIYKGPDALKVHAPPPAPEKPVEKLKVKTPAELLELNPKQRAKAERCLAEAVYFESRNEPVKGQIAVAQVVMNRVFSPYYPGEVCAVVYQNAHRHLSCQFTFACDGIPERITERGPWARAQRIAKQTLDGKLWRPEVAKSTHYHADYVKPKWIRDMRTLAKHGRHIFYRPHNWGDGRNELGWVREHEMPMPRPRPVMVASAHDAMAQAPAAAVQPAAPAATQAKPR